jgi:hypothetical protein
MPVRKLNIQIHRNFCEQIRFARRHDPSPDIFVVCGAWIAGVMIRGSSSTKGFMLKQISKLSFAAFLLLMAADPQTQPANQRTTDSGLTIIDVSHPTEPLAAQAGDMVGVQYTGKLQSSGEKFDSSLDRPRQEPLWFHLGAGQVIKGWDEGLVGMKVGDKRQLIIPPALAYGDKGTPDGPIPPNATLVFDVQLVGIYRPAN